MLSVLPCQLQTLYKYIEQKGDLRDLVPLITSLTKQKTAVTQLAKQGVKDLEELTGLLRRLGVKLPVRLLLDLPLPNSYSVWCIKRMALRVFFLWISRLILSHICVSCRWW